MTRALDPGKVHAAARHRSAVHIARSERLKRCDRMTTTVSKQCLQHTRRSSCEQLNLPCKPQPDNNRTAPGLCLPAGVQGLL